MLSHILTATYKAIVTLCLPFRVRVRVRVRVSACRGARGRSPAATAAGPGRWAAGRGGRPPRPGR